MVNLQSTFTPWRGRVIQVIPAQRYNITLPNQPPDPVPGTVAAVFSTQPIVARPVPKPVAKPADKHQQRARWPH